MSEDEIMSQEAFDEIIDNLEHIKTLTDYGKKGIKYNIKKLQEELKQEKEKNKEIEIRLQEEINEVCKLKTELYGNSISKDKIRDKQIEREFELQQEYKDFEDDIQWKTYKELLEED